MFSVYIVNLKMVNYNMKITYYYKKSYIMPEIRNKWWMKHESQLIKYAVKG